MNNKVYFIACPSTLRVKIGYTTGSPLTRLRALQTGSASELVLMAVEPVESQDRERELHERFAEQRVHGEWFDMSQEIFEYVCTIVWLQAKQSMILGEPVEAWVKRGLQTMHEDIAPLPEDLAALI